MERVGRRLPNILSRNNPMRPVSPRGRSAAAIFAESAEQIGGRFAERTVEALESLIEG